ncbi:hypothetical protein [Streptococcus gallolyticus]|uniref:Uncharacterized protein n=1 Tax=Streptococcus gallolyticus TaxID=315405 RepID=A0A1H9VA00_9STRE|nr:hypothetical protein [Streptococcus gallolyticus]SES18409.1 hypothetical protein SAMN04487840_12119 [Streptococcus gallolyticus]
MAKTKIERLSVIHRREILWLKWYFLRDKTNPRNTVLEQKIHDAFLNKKTDDAAFYVNLRVVTNEIVANTDTRLLKMIKEVYVYESINIIGACQTIYFSGTTKAYKDLNRWFDAYFYSTYKYLPLVK